MCGFVGVVANGPKALQGLPAEATEAVSFGIRKLYLRGPDAEGSYRDGCASLGHRRLKVQDLSDNANQPLQLRPDGPVIVFNGEIYNFIDLRNELLAQGYTFRTRSDTEVLLVLYEVYGTDCLDMLNGVFAFAIWHPVQKLLFLARDRLGVKPLYVGYCEWGLAFASEKQAIIHFADIDLSLNEQALVEYVWFGNTFSDRSFYRGIQSFLPGYYLLSNPKTEVRRQYWSPEKIKGSSNVVDFQNPRDKLCETLDGCVKRQLVSDLPVGLLLSGGIDSASVAASAALQGQNLIAINCEFTEQIKSSELKKAQDIADFVGIPLKSIRVSAVDVQAALYLLARHHGEPFADAANMSLYMLYCSVRDEARVILQGDGGDELFGGYNRHRLIKLRRLLNTASLFFGPMKGIMPMQSSQSNLLKRLQRIMSAFSHADHQCLALLMTLETQELLPTRIFQRDYQEHLETNTRPFLAYEDASKRFDKFDDETALFFTDLTVQLPSQFLTKVDRASMTASVEARVPLLDDELVSFALKLSPSDRTSLKKSKKLLYDSQSLRLPGKVLKSKKQGFGTPYGEWLRKGLRVFASDHILNTSFMSRFNLDSSKVEKLIADHNNHISDNGFLIWKILQMAIWVEVQTK